MTSRTWADGPMGNTPITAVMMNGIEADLDARTKKGELIIYIKDWGAVGDGITDDHDAFQNAMNYLMAQGGGYLILERGKKYRVSHSVECADNVTIMGNGATMCKLDSTDWQYAIFQTRQGAGVGYGVALKNFTVRDLNFTADFVAGRSACAFAANHAKNILFDHCTFWQFQGGGHSFDLCGSDTVTITNCVWEGFDNTHGASADGECIQVDNSLNGATSNSEMTGSWDGLPTINVTISNNKFLPLTVNGVDYPCPNPLGIHSRREGAWHTNIIFENNLIVDPVTDTSSTFRGTIHLIASAGVQIIGNTWRVTPGKTANASRAIGLYAFNTGQLATGDPNISNAVNVAISPMNCYAIRIERNRFIGFNNTSGDGNAINLIGQAGNLIDDVVIRDNAFRGMATAATDGSTYGDCIYASYVSNLKVLGNTATTCKRLIQCVNSSSVIVDDSTVTDMKYMPFYFSVVTTLTISKFLLDTYAAAMTMFSITGLTVSNIHAKNPNYTTSAQAISLRDSTKFVIAMCILDRVTAVSGSTGISVYGTSDVGYVRNNAITGYVSKATNAGTGTNITIIDNL